MNPNNSQSADGAKPQLVKSKEAAMILAMSERTLWALANKNEITPVRSGRMVRYDVADLCRWIERHKNSREAHGSGQ